MYIPGQVLATSDRWDTLFSGLLNYHLITTVVYMDFASNVYKQRRFV